MDDTSPYTITSANINNSYKMHAALFVSRHGKHSFIR